MTDDPTRLRAIIAKLVEASEVILDEYLIRSFDETGHHDPEDELEVVAMRAAINEAKEVLK